MSGTSRDTTSRAGARTDNTAHTPEVVHIITGLNNGGAEGAMFRLCTHPDSPPSMVISLMDEGLYGPKLRDAGVRVDCLNMPKGKVNLRGMVKLVRTLRQAQPKVVQTWMYHADLLGGIAARVAGVKRVSWGIRSTRLPGAGTARKVARICSSLSRVIPQSIVCCAEASAQEHVRMGYDGARMTVIGNGFDFERLKQDSESRRSFRSTLGLADDSVVLGFVARFDAQKDHANLLRALGRLAQSRGCPTFLLIGPGMSDDNQSLSDLVDAVGLHGTVRAIGTHSDIPAVMNALDLHVMSSRSEGFPNVLAEAMACGCPCISTDVGAAGLIIGDTGWLVPPQDPEALASAIEQALDEIGTEKWELRRAAARDRAASRFGIANMVAQYRKVWQL